MSRRKIKRPKAIKEAVKSLGALEQMAKLTQQLEAALKVNQALVEENNKLHEEIGLTLEDHHNDIEKLKEEIEELKNQHASYGPPVRTQTFGGGTP